MKKFKKALGIGIIASLFMAIFVWMVQDSSLKIALATWGITFGVFIVVAVGIGLATSDNNGQGNDFIADVSTRTWRIEINQNEWEYTGYANVKCKECKKIDNKKVLADGIEIEFDEEINEPYVC